MTLHKFWFVKLIYLEWLKLTYNKDENIHISSEAQSTDKLSYSTVVTGIII